MNDHDAGVAATRFDVRSPDGTTIAVWVDGTGPPLVLVHGAMSDHTSDTPFVRELRGGLTTFSMDRRGRGASGDAPGYAIEREFDDVAAVVDAVAARTGGAVALWGHSYGAGCAMGGAARTGAVAHLVLYEPGLGYRYPPGAIEKVEAALAAGDREAALLAVLRDAVEMTPEEVDFIRSSPTWPTRLGAVPTVARELRAEEGWAYRPGQFAAIGARTVVLAGSESPAAQQEASGRAAEAIPGAQVRVLEGHGHIAHRTDPAAVAALVREIIGT